MKLAAQLYTLREYLKTEGEIAETLGRVKAIGYDAVQVSGLGAFRYQWLKGAADALNLKIPVTHNPFDKIVNETDKLIEEHEIIDCPYIGLGYYKMENKDDCDAFLEKIIPAAEKIYKSGRKFCYHNHSGEFIKIEENKTVLDYLAENTEAEKFGFILDFYWAEKAGADALDLIDKYGSRMQVVHFKDMKKNASSGENDMCEIFEGKIDYVKIYTALLKAGCEWAAVEQDVCDINPFDSMKLSYDKIKARGLFRGELR